MNSTTTTYSSDACSLMTQNGNAMTELTISSDEIRSAIESYVSEYSPEVTREEVGIVAECGDGIATVEGLPSAMSNELLSFPGGVLGVALNLDVRSIGAVILGDANTIEEGQEVTRTGEVLSVPVGDAFLGRVINPLGQPIDGLGEIVSEATAPARAAGRVRGRAAGRQRAAADRHQGHRRHDADRPRPAPADHR